MSQVQHEYDDYDDDDTKKLLLHIVKLTENALTLPCLSHFVSEILLYFDNDMNYNVTCMYACNACIT